MSDRIIELDQAGYVVRVEGYPLSVIVSDSSGDILFNAGPHGLCSGIIHARRRPEFAVAAGRLVVRAADREFDLGELADGLDAGPWVASANALLRAHAGPPASVAANGHAAAEAPVAGGRS